MAFFPRLRFRKNSAGTTITRPRLNFIEGTGTTITLTDDAVDDEVDVTIDVAFSYGADEAAIDIGDALSGGAATTVARSDHQHAFPAPGAGYPIDVAETEADGTATTPARADHRHAHGTLYEGHHTRDVKTKVAADSPYTATTADEVILADATAGAITVTIPAAAGKTGYVFTIKKIDSSTSAVTVARTGADTIDGQTSYILRGQYDSIDVVSDGTNWFVI